MTDLPQDDARFEAALGAVLADLAPDAAPGSLRAAVAAVPARGERQAPGRGRAVIAVLGLAAAVVVAVAGIALLTGARPDRPAGVVPTGAVPTVVPSPSPATETFTFRVLTPDGSMATKAEVDAVGSVMEARLRAYGIASFSWSASDDRLSFEVPLPDAAPRTIASVRDLLGAPGVVEIVLLGATPISAGERVPGQPFLMDDAFTDARAGMDQAGTPTLDLAVDAQTAATFADITRTHVGEYLAVTLDGVAVAVPVINAEIPDGHLQISFAADDATPARLAAILQAGLSVSPPGPDRSRLPLPVEPVTP